MNRFETTQFTNRPSKNMGIILQTRPLDGALVTPEPNKYYTFVYKAKTPRIQYDQNPLVVCGDVFQWGFTGYNVHWNEIRRYAWKEVRSNLFELTEEEFGTLQNVPLALIKQS